MRALNILQLLIMSLVVFNTTWFGLHLLSTHGTDNVVGATRTFSISADDSVTLTEEVRDSCSTVPMPEIELLANAQPNISSSTTKSTPTVPSSSATPKIQVCINPGSEPLSRNRNTAILTASHQHRS